MLLEMLYTTSALALWPGCIMSEGRGSAIGHPGWCWASMMMPAYR